MADFYEIDFHNVTSINHRNSGDAISIRYRKNDTETIHVVDGGWYETGHNVIGHIRTYYGNPSRIDHVVVTHPDKDHCEGLMPIIQNFEVGTIWMFRPWQYANYLRHFYANKPSEQQLIRCLKAAYPFAAQIEQLGIDHAIPIVAPIAGSKIGEFSVLSPTITSYFARIRSSSRILKTLYGSSIVGGDNSSENDQSVVQGAVLDGNSIVLTGDAGENPLKDALAYLCVAGITAPFINIFQIPHHGSRQNISKATFQSWLGCTTTQSTEKAHAMNKQAVISASANDKYHPSNGVILTVMNLGVTVFTNENTPTILFKSRFAPQRPHFAPAQPPKRPNVQEIT